MSGCPHFYVPPEGPPEGINPSPLIYGKMGEDNIYKMLEDFYLLLSKSAVREMFPSDMKEASKKSAAFFVFILGGPPLYQQQFGPPRMRQRHLAFAIDESARQVWLDCFKEVLIDAEKKYCFPPEHLEEFVRFLDRFSGWMVNTSSS